MDDANGGRRGLRPRVTPELLEFVQQQYELVDAQPVDLGGSSSLNLLFVHEGRGQVVRVYRPSVSETRLAAIHQVRAVLFDGGVPIARLVESRTGAGSARYQDHLIEVEQYVEYDSVMHDWDRLAVGLPLLGHIHSLLRPINVGLSARQPLFANHIDAVDALARTRKGARRIRSWDPTPDELAIADSAEELAERLAEIEPEFTSGLHRQLVHGDFWDNNVGFRHGNLVLLADFDFMGVRPRIDDLALTLYFALSDLAAGDVSERTIRMLAGLTSAYQTGLEVPLSVQERAALPLALARQPLWSIGGWVARLDDTAAARAHAAHCGPSLATSLRILAELRQWRDAFGC